MKFLGALALVSGFLFLSSELQAQQSPAPGDHTSIAVGGRLGIDTPWNFAGGDVTINVSFHCGAFPGGHTIEVQVTAKKGETRRQIAKKLKDKIQAEIDKCEGCTSKVKQNGSIIHVTGTIPGAGANTGTPKKPILSSSNKNRPYTSTHTASGTK